MRKSSIRILFLASAVLLCSCLSNSDSEGGTEIPNGVRGRLLDQQGAPVSGATVRLFSVSYVPSGLSKAAVETAITNSEGFYSLEIPSANGFYNIEAQKGSAGVFIDSLEINGNLTVPDDTLEPLGVIRGVTHLVGQSDTNQVRATLYLTGTGKLIKPAVGGAFAFQTVPGGTYQLVVDPTLDAYSVRLLNISLAPGDTLDLDTIRLEVPPPDTVDVGGGNVSGVWGPGRTYRIYGDIAVPAGQTLRILPGTKVVFMGNYRMDVPGHLVARGKTDSMILMGYGGPAVVGNVVGHWSYLYLRGGQQDTISHTRLGDLSGFWVGGASPYLVNNLFWYARGVLLFPESTGELVMANSIFYESSYPVMVGDGMGPHTVFRGRFLNNIVVAGESVIIRDYCSSASEPVRPAAFEANSNLISTVKDALIRNCGSSAVLDTITFSNTLRVSRMTADDQFVSVATGQEDFHLKPGAPARGAGIDGTDLGIYSTYVPE